MCNIVVINKGEKEIETPRQFLEYFGFMPDKELSKVAGNVVNEQWLRDKLIERSKSI